METEGYSLRARCRTTFRMGQGRRGFTVVEMVVATAILGVVTGMAVVSFNTALDGGGTTTVIGHARSQAEKIVQQLARDIRYSSTSSDGWEFPAETEVTAISLSRCTGWDGATQERTWGPVIQYSWEIDTAGGETEDGADNNGNGIVDEGNLFCRRGTGPRTVIGRHVERDSFLLIREETADGSAVTIRVGVAMPNPAHPDSTARGVYETTVTLRN